jgi:hypothetical protein
LKLKAVFQQSQTFWTAELQNQSPQVVPHSRESPFGTPSRAFSAGPRIVGLSADEIALPAELTNAVFFTEIKKGLKS